MQFWNSTLLLQRVGKKDTIEEKEERQEEERGEKRETSVNEDGVAEAGVVSAIVMPRTDEF